MSYERVDSSLHSGDSSPSSDHALRPGYRGDVVSSLDLKSQETLNKLHMSFSDEADVTDGEESVDSVHLQSPAGEGKLSQYDSDENDKMKKTVAEDLDDIERRSLDENSPTSAKLKFLLKNAAPVACSFLLSMSGSLLLMIYAGHERPVNTAQGLAPTSVFAGVSLATLFCNVTFRSLIIGVTGAVETLCSQNNGARNYREVGLTLQRSIVLLHCIAITSVILWWHAEQIFVSLNIEPDVAYIVGQYVRIRIFEMPFNCFNESYEKYLMSIGVVRPPLYANISLNITCASLCYLFYFGMGFDFRCLAVAWVLSSATGGVVMMLTSRGFPAVQNTLVECPCNPFDPEARRHWVEEVLPWCKVKQFLNLGWPGTVMLCGEWWAFEALNVMAAQLGTEELAAQTIVLQLAALAFMVPIGISVTTASIVGNALGSKKRAYAQQMSEYALILVFVCGLGVGALILAGGRQQMMLFTNDEKVLDIAESTLSFLSVFCVIDGCQGVCGGIMRGTGKQMVGAVANIVCFFGVGIPAAYFLCFKTNLMVPGLMVGISIGVFLQVTIMVYFIKVYDDYIFTAPVHRDGALVDKGDVDEGDPMEYSTVQLSQLNLAPSAHGLIANEDFADDMSATTADSRASSSYNVDVEVGIGDSASDNDNDDMDTIVIKESSVGSSHGSFFMPESPPRKSSNNNRNAKRESLRGGRSFDEDDEMGDVI